MPLVTDSSISKILGFGKMISANGKFNFIALENLK